MIITKQMKDSLGSHSLLEIHQGASMEIESGLRSEKGNTAPLGNNGGPVLEHKMPKNVLEDMLVGQ